MKDLSQWWKKVKENPSNALTEFLSSMRDKEHPTFKQGSLMLAGDESSWQYGSSSLEDAVNFLITNYFMKADGLGVKLKGKRNG